MNPLHLSAHGYRTFDTLDIDLPTGTVAVVGPNGAGKSSILNLIDVALFAERGELAPLLTVGEEEMEIALTFEHAGELYRVRRQYSARGRGKTTCDFERRMLDDVQGGAIDFASGAVSAYREAAWEPLTRETADATNALIASTLGLSRTTFRASSFLAQGDGAAFTEAQPRERKAMLAEILGLSKWDDLQALARRDLRGCEDELLKSRALIDGCAELVEAKPLVERMIADSSARLATASESLALGEAQYEEAQRELAAAAVLAEQVRTAEAELAAARDAHKRAVEEFSGATYAADALVDRKIELDDVAADADQVPALEARLAEIVAVRQAYQDASALRQRFTDEADHRTAACVRLGEQAQEMRVAAALQRTKAGHLEEHIGEASSCDRCGQTLGAEAAARAAASYRAEADEITAKADQIEDGCAVEFAAIGEIRTRAASVQFPVIPAGDDPKLVETALTAARRAAERKASLVEQVRQLTEKTARRDQLEQLLDLTAEAVSEKQAALEIVKQGWRDETALQSAVSRWRIAIHEARGLIETRQADLVRAQTELERIVLAEQTLNEHRGAVETISKRVDVLKIAEKAYGRDGIPALIVENAAIPQLELEANRILGELGGATAGCRIELRTQKALKSSAEQLRETLDIVIVTSTGTRVYETFSGGERTRLNLALRISLARLLAHRRGAESRVLCIDEPDGLDMSGMQALATVLQGVGGDFERVLLVSHHPELATAFDQTIVVVKDGERSRVDAGVLIQPSDSAVAA